MHVEREVVQLTLVYGYGGIDKPVEFDKGIHVFPYAVVVGVENMGTVPVYVDSIHILAPGIPASMWPPVDDQAGFTPFFDLVRRHCPEQTRSNNKKIIFIHIGFDLFSRSVVYNPVS
jgi:hypothetical protein